MNIKPSRQDNVDISRPGDAMANKVKDMMAFDSLQADGVLIRPVQ